MSRVVHGPSLRNFHVILLTVLGPLTLISEPRAQVLTREVAFVAQEHTRGDELYPQLEVEFTDDTSARIPRELVFDQQLDERFRTERLTTGVYLSVDNRSPSREVVLLTFDAAAWLQLLGKTADQIRSASLRLSKRPVAPSQFHLEHFGLISLYAPPAGSTWTASTLAGHALSWNEAGPKGVLPDESTAPYPEASFLQGLNSSEEARTVSYIRGDYFQDMISGQTRFFGKPLTDHLRSELAAGRKARFIVYAKDALPKSPGLEDGVWPSSSRGDSRASRLAKSNLIGGEGIPALKLTGKATIPDFGVSGFENILLPVVGADDSLTFVYRSSAPPYRFFIARYDKSVQLQARTEISAFCPDCPTSGALGFFEVVDLHLLADRSLVVVYMLRSPGTGDKGRPRVARYEVSGASFVLRRDVPLPDRTVPVGQRKLPLVDSNVSPTGNVFVTTSDFTAGGPARLFEVNPITGQVLELPAPPELIYAPLFDLLGNRFHVWTRDHRDDEPQGLRVHMSSFAPNGSERFHFTTPPEHSQTPNHSGCTGDELCLNSAVSDEGPSSPGRLYAVVNVFTAPSTRKLYTVEPTQNDFLLHEMAVGGSTTSLDYLDGRGRVVFRRFRGPNSGNLPIFVSRTGLALEDSSDFPLPPTIATLQGFVAELGEVVLVDADGKPLLATPPLAPQMRAVLPSRNGLYTTEFAKPDILYHWERGAGADLSVIDRPPLEDRLAPMSLEACFMPNSNPDNNPALVADYRLRQLLFECTPQEMIPDFNGFERVSGMVDIPGGFPYFDCADHQCEPGEQKNTWFFCPGTERGVAWVVGNNGCFGFDPTSKDRWRTVRRFFTEGTPATGQLRLTPASQEIFVTDTATISARDGTNPVQVQFTLSGDVSRLATPLETVSQGTSITLVPRGQAGGGTVTVTAKAQNGQVARAIVNIKRRPRLIALNPDPNPDPNDPPAQKGGTFYRYFRVVEGPVGGGESDLRYPDLSAVFKVRETNHTLIAHALDSAPFSHLPVLKKAAETARGLTVLKIPWADVQAAVTAVPVTLHLDLQHLVKPSNAAILQPEQALSIELKLDDRPYEKKLQFSTATEGTLLALQATVEGSGTVGFEDKNSLSPGVDSQLIEWERLVTLGLSFPLGELDLGGFKIDGPEAKGGVVYGVGESFKFEPSTADTALQHFEILQAVEAARSGGPVIGLDMTNPFRGLLSVVSFAVSQVVNPAVIAMRREAKSFKVGLKAAFEVNLQFGIFSGRDAGRSRAPQSLFLEVAGFALEHAVAFNLMPMANAHELIAQLETDAKLELIKIAFFGIPLCPGNLCTGTGYTESVTVDTTGANRPLKSISFTQKAMDETLKPFEKTWTLEGPDAITALRGNCSGNLGALAFLARCTNCAPCGSTSAAAGALKVSLVPAVLLRRIQGSFRDVSELKSVKWEQTAVQQQAFDLTIGGQVLGFGVKLSTGKEITQESRGMRGVLLKPRGGTAIEYPLESYPVPDTYIPNLGAEEEQLGFFRKLTTAIQAFSSAALLVEFELFGSQAGMIRHPPGGRGTSTVPPLALDITYNQNVQVDVSAWPMPELDANAPVERNDIPAFQPSGPQPATLLVGAFHDFHQNPPPPDGTAQIVSAVLRIGYLPSELGGIAESRLQMGRWYPGDFSVPAGRWDLLGGTVNDANDTVTINSGVQEGTYGVLFRTNLTCPTVQPLSVTAGQVAITWTAAPEADVNGYSLYRAPRGSKTFERIATLGLTQTSYTDLVPGDTRMFSYAVAARFGPGAEGCIGAARATDGDGDQISDLFEIEVGLNPNQSNISTDMDSDGLTDGEEVRIRTNPALADTDSDGLEDGDEVDTHKTEPLIADTDGDGVSDGTELLAGTNPLIADSDADGLLEGEEVTYHCDPLKVDTDEDGIIDGDEVRLLGTNPARADTDRDGVWDLAEIEIGTDPLDADTDGDGAGDGRELGIGTDPLDPSSFPEVLFVPGLSRLAAAALLTAVLGLGSLLVAALRKRRAG